MKEHRNLVVVVPDGELEHTERDKLGGGEGLAWWRLPQTPRRDVRGAWIYFRHGASIIGRARILYVTAEPPGVALSWPACAVVWRIEDAELMERAPADGPAFRGFKYSHELELAARGAR